MIKFIGIAAIAGVLLGAGTAWHLTASYKDARHAAAIAAMQQQAAVALAAATDRALAVERANVEIARKMEVQHAKNQRALDRVHADNRRLARELGGLRDPGAVAVSCPLPAAAAGAGLVADPAAAGRLSDEATEFLLEFAREADRAAEYAGTCYEWVKAIGAADG